MTKKDPRKKAFENFKEEVEMFFMTKFITGNQLEMVYSDCLDILYNLSGTKDGTRGIMAFNPRYGQGKSFFFDVVNHRHRRKYGRNLFKKTTARELCLVYTSCPKNEDPEKRLLKFINCRNLFIDDIGDELSDGKERSHYSNKLNILRFVLLRRYELWIEKGFRTYGTTNLTIEQFGNNYDGRVADRVLQMTHFVKFEFLKEGSFRQIQETRKLTASEIRESWDRLKKVESVERIDLETYFNELINEPDEYFEQKDLSFWSFVKDYLIEKDLLDQNTFNSIDETALDSAELILKRDTRESIKSSLKHAKTTIQTKRVSEAFSKITKNDIYKSAENIIARRKFFELRTKNHKFK